MSGCIDPRFQELLGAYVLGACTPEEAEGMRAHLVACASCAHELAELHRVREALMTAVRPMAPDPALKDDVMRRVRADAELFAAARPAAQREQAGGEGRLARLRDRLSRPVPLFAAAVCAIALLVGGAAIGAALLGGGSSPGGARVVLGSVDTSQAPGARARIVESGGSRRLVVTGMPDPGPGRVYQVWLRNGSAAPRPSGALFSVDTGGRGEAPVPGDLAGADQVLVSNEPDGGSQQPTRTPVVSVPL